MEKKRLNITIDVNGEAGEYLHKAVQKVLFSKEFGWAHNGKVIQNYCDAPLYIEMDTGGTNKKIWQLRSDGIAVKATDILSGAFDLDKWIKDNTKKEEPKNVIYCVDLTWVKGEAREVLSAALQKKAFEKGYRWAGVETTIQNADHPGLFFDTSDNTVCYSNDFVGGKDSCKYSATPVEISVNKALRGEYRSVK